MTTRKKRKTTGSRRGGYDYMDLLLDFRLTDKDTDWMDLAACKNMDTDKFFFHHAGRQQIKGVVEICNQCPVRERCRDWAVTNEITYGIWGGLTPNQRRQYWHY
jgi:WhiB family redox-sensing transcriptional regulator